MNSFFKTISRLPLIAIFALCLLSAANADPVIKWGGNFQENRISGSSMLPTLQSGETAVIYKAYPFEKIRIGDVVIIESSKGYSVIHRVVSRSRGGSWVTKGDNNRYEDSEELNSHNFGGLALVDQSIGRYQKYVAKFAPEGDEHPDIARYIISTAEQNEVQAFASTAKVSGKGIQATIEAKLHLVQFRNKWIVTKGYAKTEGRRTKRIGFYRPFAVGIHPFNFKGQIL